MPDSKPRKLPVLVIIYNNKFPENIKKLEYIYKGRFSRIFHLMPFYIPKEGEQNVITVYDKPTQFQAHVAQGLAKYSQDNASHYIFIADDLLLNPEINENNYQEYFQLRADMGYFGTLQGIQTYPPLISHKSWWHRSKRLFPWSQLYKFTEGWGHAHEAYLFNPLARFFLFNPTKSLPETTNLLDPNEVILLLKNLGISKHRYARRGFRFTKLHYYLYYPIGLALRVLTRVKIFYFLLFPVLLLFGIHFALWPYKLRYPLVQGYSDIVVIPSEKIEQFAYYCGIFAATDLFAEIAIPSAYVLSKIQGSSAKDLKYKLHEGAWSGVLPLLNYQDETLDNIINNFPCEYLYIHPIKLSELKITKQISSRNIQND